jgi:CBS domain containing-hemolysin-like protein
MTNAREVNYCPPQEFAIVMACNLRYRKEMLADTWVKYPEQTGIIVLLVAANAFFVATEFAFVKIRGSQLKSMQVKGKKDWRLGLAIRVTKHLDRYLSATQLGITLTSLGLGFVGEPVVAEWLKKPVAHFDAATGLLAMVHISRDLAVDSIAYTIAFASITFFHIVLGELVPKYFAIQRPRTVVMWFAPPLVIFYHVCYPFIWLLNRTANRLLIWMGIPLAKEFDHGFNQEELQYVLMNSRHVHPSDELVNKLMLKALRLKETTAEQVMLPRDQVVMLWRDKSVADNLAIAQKSGYSRLPFCGDSPDQILGVIHVKELLWQYQVLGAQTSLAAIVRPVLTFMTKTRLPAMLELFRRSRNHLALVLDADEKMLGLVSFEDVLEELVGDIRDEFDIEKGPFFERSADAVLVDADLPLRDLAVETGWPLSTQTTDTVEQWALRHWGFVPHAGAQLEIEGFQLTCTEVGARRIRRLRVVRLTAPPSADSDSDSDTTAEIEAHVS